MLISNDDEESTIQNNTKYILTSNISAWRKSESKTAFIEYQVSNSFWIVKLDEGKQIVFKWVVWRRFSLFESFHNKLRIQKGKQLTIEFPSKNISVFDKFNANFVTGRRNDLIQYWQKVMSSKDIAHFSENSTVAALKVFLDFDLNTRKGGTPIKLHVDNFFADFDELTKEDSIAATETAERQTFDIRKLSVRESGLSVSADKLWLNQEDHHTIGTKIWWQGKVCVLNMDHAFFPSMAVSKKMHNLFLLPGRVAWIDDSVVSQKLQIKLVVENSECMINCFLIGSWFAITSVDRDRCRLVVEDRLRCQTAAIKPTRYLLQFGSLQLMREWEALYIEEGRRLYIDTQSMNPLYRQQLNDHVRASIERQLLCQSRSTGLRKMFYSCYNKDGCKDLIAYLYSICRSLHGFETDHASSFAEMLRHLSEDPVILILFVCCQVDSNLLTDFLQFEDANPSTVQSSSKTARSSTKSIPQRLERLMDYVLQTISSPNWKVSRTFILSLFEYPVDFEVDSLAVLQWEAPYLLMKLNQKFSLTFRKLQMMLENVHFLRFACLKHYADIGDIDKVKKGITSFPCSELFTNFNIDALSDGYPRSTSSSSSSSIIAKKDKPHFIELIFHPNLQQQDVFKLILQTFESGKGYDKNFFEMFLNQAISRQTLRIPLNLIHSSLLIESDGKTKGPCIEAISFCSTIPYIILDGILASRGRSGQYPCNNDEGRALLEIAMRFEYISICCVQLRHLFTISQMLTQKPNLNASFIELIESLNFSNYASDICRHNLLNDTTVTATASSTSDRFLTAEIVQTITPSAPPLTEVVESRIPTYAAQVQCDPGAIAVSSDDAGGEPIAIATVWSELKSESRTSPQSISSHSRKESSSRASLSKEPSASTTSNVRRSALGSLDGQEKSIKSFGSNAEDWRYRDQFDLTALLYSYVTLVIDATYEPNSFALNRHGLLSEDVSSNKNNSKKTEINQKSIKGSAIIMKFLQKLPVGFYTKLLAPGTELRSRLIEYLRDKFNICPVYYDMFNSDMMLTNYLHFDFKLLRSFTFVPKHLSAEEGLLLLQVAFKLQDYDELLMKLQNIDTKHGGFEENKKQLEMFCRTIYEMEALHSDSTHFMLDELDNCVTITSRLMNQLEPNSQEVFDSACEIEDYIVANPPSTWLSFLNDLSKGSSHNS